MTARTFSIEEIFRVITEAKLREADSGSPLTTDTPKVNLLDFLPTIQISEDWGVIGTKDRIMFEKFMNRVPGDTLEAKIESINNFVSGADQASTASVAEILSHLMFLQLLSKVTVSESFSAPAAGFIFEAFMAGLMRGKQITDVEDGNLPITDIEIWIDPETGEGHPVSLKLLAPGGGVKGSIHNLLYLLSTPKGAGGVEYLVAYKWGDKKLGLYSITINRQNLYDWLQKDFYFQYTPPPEEINEAKDPQAVAKKRAVDDIRKGFLKFAIGMSVNAAVNWDPNTPVPPAVIAKLEKPVAQEWLQRLEQYARDANEAGYKPESVGMYTPEMVDRHLWHDEGKTIPNIRGRAKMINDLRWDLPPDHEYGYLESNPAIRNFSKTSSVDPETGEKTHIKPGNLPVEFALIEHGMEPTLENLIELSNTNSALWFEIMKKAMMKLQFGIAAGAFTSPTSKPAPNMLRRRHELIDLAPETIRTTAEKYTAQLMDLVVPIYQSLSNFTNNINEYFLLGSIDAGTAASEDAQVLKDHADKLAPPAIESEIT